MTPYQLPSLHLYFYFTIGKQRRLETKHPCSIVSIDIVSNLNPIAHSAVPSFFYLSKQGDIHAGSVIDSTNTVSAREQVTHLIPLSLNLLGHPRRLSKNDSKPSCYFQKTREDVPIQGFTALCAMILI